MTKAAAPLRSALVTGGARRIGRAISIGLAREGFRVAVHHHSSAKEARAVVAEIEEMGGTAVAVAGDLARPATAERLVTAASDGIGPINCLVNNASLFLYDDIATLSEETWQAHMDVNLKAPVFLARAFARQLPEDHMGSIVNLIDERVWRPTPLFLSYAIAKSALWAATQMLAQALAPRIRVNAIGPGPTLPSVYQTKEQFEGQAHATPLRQGSSPEEIASAVIFLTRTASMTGQMIALDGGQHLAWQTPDVTGHEP
ncbi:MAG: SDR family oxidoreductase [Hyphomicrobiaceae bacterium]